MGVHSLAILTDRPEVDPCRFMIFQTASKTGWRTEGPRSTILPE